MPARRLPPAGGNHLRVLLPALLLLGAALALSGAPRAQADAGALAGTWAWSYPNVVVPAPDGPHRPLLTQTQEPGTLALGSGPGEWRVELPSASVGCSGGKPQYAPKAGQTALVTTYPDGTCTLYVYDNGHLLRYTPYWSAGREALGATAGPFWGTGDFQ